MPFDEMVRAVTDKELYALLSQVNEEIARRRISDLPEKIIGVLDRCWFPDGATPRYINTAAIERVAFGTVSYDDGRFFVKEDMEITFADGEGDPAGFDDIDGDEAALDELHSLLHEITLVLREREGIESITTRSVLRVEIASGAVEVDTNY